MPLALLNMRLQCRKAMVEPMRLLARRLALLSATILGLGCATVALADEPKVIVGKDNWLFFSQEIVGPDSVRDVDTSVDLVGRLSGLFQANGVQMVYALVPAKMRVYGEQLPDQWKMPAHMQGNYARIVAQLKSRNVNVIDINAALLQSPLRKSASPVFLKGDTRWSPLGALVAAEAIRKGIEGSPSLEAAFQATPVQKFTLEFNKQLTTLPAGDLASKIPNAAKKAPEQSLLFNVTRSAPAEGDARVNASAKITLAGSTYSGNWTMFADALRFALQRDILALSVTEDKGPWVGLIEAYVSSNQFQTAPPRLLIWEAVEKELIAPPAFAYRDKQFVSDNTDWLLRVSAWIQRSCKPSTVKPVVAKAGLVATDPAAASDTISANGTSPTDFVEIVFDPPATRLDYLTANVVASGAQAVTLEIFGANGESRRIPVSLPADGRGQLLRAALPGGSAGYSKVRLFPGKTDKFSVSQIAVCAQPDGLVK